MKDILLSLLAGVWVLFIFFAGGWDFSQRGFDLGYALFGFTLVTGFTFAFLKTCKP